MFFADVAHLKFGLHGPRPVLDKVGPLENHDFVKVIVKSLQTLYRKWVLQTSLAWTTLPAVTEEIKEKELKLGATQYTPGGGTRPPPRLLPLKPGIPAPPHIFCWPPAASLSIGYSTVIFLIRLI